ncbi:DUF5753 domain-containing protein [Streptomyces sp. NPDC059452]|uniref:DUF5753 domain-containing protein n=1 Tax=Streptomyces sp. NPDC059452 TaxID=3346835 RepID=UPI0036915DD4
MGVRPVVSSRRAQEEGDTVTSSVPWQERLSSGTEAVQDEVIRWYQETPHGQAYVPTMIWGTLQTEAYATVILGQVVDFLGVPNDVPAGVAKRTRRQQVLYDGEHRYDVVLGEQALYTNIGGPEVMRDQIDRILRDIDLPSLALGIIPATALVDMLPVHAFNLHGDGVHVELVSSALTVTEPAELGLYREAFSRLSGAALYGDDAKELLRKARSFWSGAEGD